MTVFFDYILDELRLKDVPDGSGGFWGSFYDTTTQTISSTASEYPITLNSLSGSNGISRASLTERVVFDYAGVYSITFSAQFDNSTADDQLATIWLKKNGVNLSDSASVTSIPKKHGSDNGQVITTVNYVLELQANDYLETYWRGANANLRLVTLSSASSPNRPLSPSIIWTAVQGGIIQGSTSNSLASLTDVAFTSLASGQIIMSNASGNWGNVNFPAIPSIPSLGSLAVLNSLSYTSLTNLPSLGSLAVLNNLSFTSLLNQPSLSSLAFQSTIDYTSAQLTNKPSLGSLAVLNSLSYASLTNLPSLGSLAVLNSLSYTSLSNLPSLGSLAILNDLSYTSLLNLPSLGSLAVLNSLSFTSLTNQPSLSSLAFQSTIDYTSSQLTNKPSLGSLAQQNTVDYVTQVTSKPSLGSLAVLNSLTKTDVGLSNVTNDAQLKIASNLSDLNNVSTARGNLSLGSLAVSNTINGFLPSTASFNLLYTNGIFNTSTISTNLLYSNNIFASSISVGNITGNNGAFASTVSANRITANQLIITSTASIYNLNLQGTLAGSGNINISSTIFGTNLSGTNTGDQIMPVYGDGADSNVTFDGSDNSKFATYDSGTATYTLTRDVFATYITVDILVTVITAGYRLFAQNEITNNGTIHNNGSAGSGTTAGAGGLGGFFKAGGNGATGLLAASAGANGTAQATPTANTWVGGLGGRGGQGRLNTTTFHGGQITSANVTAPANADGGSKVTSNYVNYLTRYVVGATNWQMTPSIGGGSGAKSIIGTTATSGAGGGGGGVLFVAAPVISGSGAISANGGAGGNAAGTGGSFGGGGGGGGGVACMIAKTATTTPTAVGGTGGTSVFGTNGTLPVALANGTNTTATTTLTLTPTTALSKGKLYLITFHLNITSGIGGSGVNNISGYGISWFLISSSRVEYSTIATPTRVQETWYGRYTGDEPDLIQDDTITVTLSDVNTTARAIIDEITNVDADVNNNPVTSNVATNRTNSATTLTVTLPTAPTTGNLVYSVFTRSAGTATTAGAGNTLVNNQTTAPQISSQVSSAQTANIQTHTTAAAVAGFSVEITASASGSNGSTGWDGKVIRIYG